MKRSNLSNLVGASLLALSLTTLPLSLPASAQNNAQSSPTVVNDNGPVLDSTPFKETKGVVDNWGWLGVLGLLGLLNLFRREPEAMPHTDYRETDTAVITEEPVSYQNNNKASLSDTSAEPVRYQDPNQGILSNDTEKAVRFRDPSEVRRSDTDGSRY